MSDVVEQAAVGFYDRLRRLAKAGKWEQALALMRTNDLPAMKGAFRTTSSGVNGYRMEFKFHSMAEMRKANSEWHEFRKATDAP
jgi:hypothetical protein